MARRRGRLFPRRRAGAALTTARLGALALGVLVVLHLAFRHVFGEDSPVWKHWTAVIDQTIEVSAGIVGLAIAAVAIVVAVAVWRGASRIAAGLFALAALAELYWRLDDLVLGESGANSAPLFAVVVTTTAAVIATATLLATLFNRARR